MNSPVFRTTLTIDRVPIPAVFSEESRDRILLPLLRGLTVRQKEAGRRLIVFLGAAPGAGKSVLLAYLEKLSRETPGLCPVQVLGLDGFHRTNAWLKAHETDYEGNVYNLRAVKGWPETFRPEDLHEKIVRMKAEKEVLCPVYDRNLHEPVEDRLLITADIVLIEGMWMLYDQGPWAALQEAADYRILLLAKIPVLRERATARKVRGGMTPEDARHFFDTTDCMAIRRILAHVAAPDLVLESAEDYRLISYGDACPDLAPYLP
ncbi:MAG: nucleoside/nucleotide kinase family protein [Lachnospiraceae bacterium]|nr:nucleoside/nucleotide kinase family protein [Lachnospiraceae bacterium]